MKILDSKGNPISPEITPEMEATAQGKAREFQATLVGKRIVLNADQLANLVSPGVRLEQRYEFPDKSAWFFTINGVMQGKRIGGALFAGECILVFASSETEAKSLAQRGLRETVDLLHEEYLNRREREQRDLIQQGVHGADVGGRRMHQGGFSGEQSQKMSRIIADVFSRK